MNVYKQWHHSLFHVTNILKTISINNKSFLG